jgi:hypothetical protein
MSASDQRKGMAGSRTAVWTKDLIADERPFEPKSGDALLLIDVDMYLDMPKFLATHFMPTLIYTFLPTHVARNGDVDPGSPPRRIPEGQKDDDPKSRIEKEYTFTFNAANEVVYHVAGGGQYQHKVWNYSYDNIAVYTTCLGITTSFAVFQVDRRRLSSDREVIALMPVVKHGILTAWFHRYFFGYQVLKRLEVVTYVVSTRVSRVMRAMGLTFCLEAYTRLHVQHDKLYACTGRPDSYAASKVTADIDDAIRDTEQISASTLSASSVKPYNDGNIVTSPVLCAFHRSMAPFKPPIVQPAKDSMNVYQFFPKSFNPEAKPIVKPFMTPVMAEAFVPTDAVENDIDGVIERIEKVRPPLLPQTDKFLSMVEEFATHLIPEPHQLHPVDQDYVYEMQCRPTQRRLLDERVIDPVCQRIIQSFVKKETYGGLKPTRLISTINASDKCDYSMFIYRFASEVMKKQPWYAFGKSPAEVAQRVADLCTHAKTHVVPTDLSKFDGHCSNLVRVLERTVLLRAFSQEHSNQLIDLHESQFGLTCFLRSGVSYDQAFARASGSPETAAFNSVVNAFIAYMALRESGLTRDEAWQALGVYGGDDGLTPDVAAGCYIKAADIIGQKLTISEIPRDGEGVSFLARMYSPVVWHGSTNSTCDLPRQLSKFHLTAQVPTLADEKFNAEKLKQKVIAFSFTDANTPVIRDIIQTYLRFDPIQCVDFFNCTEDEARIRPWQSLFALDTQYPNENDADWMEHYLDTAVEGHRYDDWKQALAAMTSIDDILTKMPLLRTPPELVCNKPVIVNGEVLAPVQGAIQDLGEDVPDMEKAEGHGSKKKHSDIKPDVKALAPCRDFNNGQCQRKKCIFRHVLYKELSCTKRVPHDIKDCPYSHVSTPRSSSESDKDPKMSEKPCRDFAAGKCTRGDRCKWVHPVSETAPKPEPQCPKAAARGPSEPSKNKCFAFEKHGKCPRKNCRYLHQKEL